MTILSKLLVALGLDASDYQKGLDDAERKAGTSATAIGSKLEGIGKSMMKTGGIMTAAVTGPLAALGIKSMDAASDLEESMNKVRIVFGNAAGSVEGFASTAAESLGMSQQAALEAAGTFGNLFTAMGIGEAPAAEMSTGLLTLASDLASFNNIDPEVALDKLRAGLVGEAEPLRTLGVNLNEAATKAKAMELGLAGTAEELTAADLVTARYALIMEQTANAQGDFARTSDGMANSQRIAKAELADAAATIGTQLLPYGLKLVQFVSDLIDKFTNLSPETQKIITVVAALAAAIGPVLLVAGSLATGIGAITTAVGAVGGAITAVIGTALGPILLIIAAIVAAVVLFKLAWDNNFLGIRDTLTAVWEQYLKPAFEAVKGWLEVFLPQAIQWLTDMWNNVLLPAIRAVWNWIQTNLIPLFRALADVYIAAVRKALEILAALWKNVLKPALEALWKFIGEKVVPILEALWGIVEEKVGPVLQWFGDTVLAGIAGFFDDIGAAIQWVIDRLQEFANWLANIEIPTWLQGGSPPPLANWLTAIGDATEELARVQLPELEVALRMRTPSIPAFAGTVGTAGGGGGDTYVIHNHNPLAAALNQAWIEDRRRARLNRGM